MCQSKKRPQSAISVTRYQDLDPFVEAFANGHLNLLVLVGAPGLQKSRGLRDAVGESASWIEGHATPFGIYRKLWENRNRPVVIDDIDGLYSSGDGLRLLKCLCQTEPLKTVSWHSEVAALRRERIPREFTTISHVAIIANEWKTLNRNVAAVEDRGICILFEPPPSEVHVRTGAWFWDQEIFDFIGERLHFFSELSMRLYHQLWELKSAGMDWRSFVLQRSLKETTRVVAELRADASYSSEKARVEAFIASGGGSRATYFNHVRKLRPSADTPKITLKNSPPKEVRETLLEEILIDLLRRGRRQWENN